MPRARTPKKGVEDGFRPRSVPTPGTHDGVMLRHSSVQPDGGRVDTGQTVQPLTSRAVVAT